MRILLPLATIFTAAKCCSNILITPGASADGNAMIAYNADDAALHGAISHWPAKEHAPGTMRDVYSWDLGIYLGSIPEEARTYNVMGNANCQGLVIGETTLGGLSELSNVGKTGANGTILDYGSLIYITLQRAATAREAITTIADLTNKYGYASDMEGFSLSDPSGEVWYMELIGKGSFEKGILYVALRVPDGYVAAHANQARITTFLPCDDASQCMASPDVVSFAIERGYWKGGATDPSFSFSDIYDPVSFEGARFCEARVWNIFHTLAGPGNFDAPRYLDYAKGYNLTNRMPLFVKPAKKLTRAQVHQLMSHHFNGTFFDPSTDVGAGAELSPYRWNGLEWHVDGDTYVNERVVGTHYTAWHFVATIRPPPMPKQMAALLHWGADDHSWSPKIPVFGGASEVHPSYDDFNCTGRDACRVEAGLAGTVKEFSWHSAWWVAQVVADQVYTRKERAAATVLEARKALEVKLETVRQAAEAKAVPLYRSGDATAGQKVLNEMVVQVGGTATETWAALWQKLIVSFVDGKITTSDPSNHVCGCKKTSAAFGDAWKEKVVADAGAHYKKPDHPQQLNSYHDKPARSKLSIRGVAA